MTTFRYHPAMVTAIILSAALVFASPAWSFDDERRGFTLGLGMGFSPVAQLRGNDDGVALEDDAAGLAWAFKAGLGMGDHDVLAFEGNLAMVDSDLYGDSSHQSFTGLVWTHYFGSPGRAFFGSLGYGKYKYEWQGSRHYICWGDECDPPPRLPGSGDRTGYLLGAGYEFALHWQLGAYAALGRSEYEGDFSFTHVTVLVQYNWF